MIYTDNQLKAALARALPDKLSYREGFLPKWKDEKTFVTDHEWPAIVSMAFNSYLLKENRSSLQYSYFSPVASWQEIAEYLVYIGAITIE